MDDIEADASRMTLRRALFEGVIFQLRTYLWALRRPQARRNWIIAEGIAVLVMLIAAVSASPWTIIPLVYVALMIAGSWIIPLITSYLPHNSEAADEIHQTRFYRGLIFRVFALDHLYHLEHHLYPIVPHQNWPRLARRLDPWLESVGLKPSQLWH